ncbi:MAG: PilN domain-containing protein [Deltaproteobacteria bacterium]|nr:PilN domain-containing protein [Deltaproteobacteria bacterium]
MEPIKINLATFEYQDKRLSYTVMLVTALIILIISFISIRSGINAQNEINEYENKVALKAQDIIKRQQIKKETVKRLSDKEIESLKKDISFINGLIMTDAYPYDRLLDALEVCVPQGLAILNYSLSKDQNVVSLKGKAGSMDEITVFLDRLNSSRIYKNSSLLNLTVSRENIMQEEMEYQDNGITFEIECSIDSDQVWAATEGRKTDD